MERQTLQGERWRERAVSGETFRNIDLTDCSFHGMQFSNCTFISCRFKNCYIGFSCSYDQSTFDRCSFTGQYSAFGNDCQFSQCSFEATTIRSGSMVTPAPRPT